MIDLSTGHGRNRPLVERLWSRVERDGPVPSHRPELGACWMWTGAKDEHGYGRIQHARRYLRPHRVVYMVLVGEIPEGLVLDHLCRNPSCVNPDHLEPVTDRVNILRGFGMGARSAQATHCRNGHPWTPENTYTFAGHRDCRECHRQAMKAWRARRPKAPKCRGCKKGTWHPSGYCQHHREHGRLIA